jgi:thiamine transport system permease protein
VIIKKNYLKYVQGMAIVLLPFTFLVFFYFNPLFSTFRLAWDATLKTGLDIHLWSKIGRPLGFTFFQAGLSTLFTSLVGIPAAYMFARFRFRGKSIFRLLTAIPFIMPTVVVAAGFNALLGPKGWLNLLLQSVFNFSNPPIQILNTLGAILLAHVFYNTTVMIRILGGAWSQLDPKMEHAARTLGASPFRVWLEITLPLLRPALISALLLIFMFDFTSFAVILLLGGPAFTTLEVEIYIQALNMLNLPVAGLLSAIQLFCTLGMTILYSWLNHRLVVPLTPRDPREVEKPAKAIQEKVFLGGMLGILFILLVLPLASLIMRSFLKLDAARGERGIYQSGFTLAYYKELFINRRQSLFYVPPFDAFINSLWIGLVTVFIALVLGFLAAKAISNSSKWLRWFDVMIMLPLGTSAVTLGLGFLLTFNNPPIDVKSFPLLIPIAHSLVALPFVVRILQPVIVSIPTSIKQSAAVLGASPWRVWLQIELPILWRAFLSAGIFAFTISLGEFGATTFLSRPEMPTIPIAIYRYISQPGALNYGQALAMATILMIICGFSIFLVEKLRLPGLREF